MDAEPDPRNRYDGPEVPVNRAPNLTRIAAVSAPAVNQAGEPVAATLNENLGNGLQLARARAAAGVNGGFWPLNPHGYGTPEYEEWDEGEGPRLIDEYMASARLVRHVDPTAEGGEEAVVCFVKPGDPTNVYSLRGESAGELIGPRDSSTTPI